jgi:hypothetical protein
MPDLTGLEVLDQLKKMKRARGDYGLADPQLVDEGCAQAGAFDFVGKPLILTNCKSHQERPETTRLRGGCSLYVARCIAATVSQCDGIREDDRADEFRPQVAASEATTI